jgi:hypothetical protein
MAYRTADHAMMLSRRAREAEGRYARTKKHSDLTDVISLSAEAKNTTANAVAEKSEHKGTPIGQRWE